MARASVRSKVRSRVQSNMNPLDEALSEKEKVAAKRRAEDFSLWDQWKTDPTTDNMQSLMQRFEPVFRQKTQQWKAPNVNDSAFRANLKVQAVDAFQTYDPNRGTALRTHLENRLRKSMRFNTQHQNYAYIPEGPSGYIGKIQKVTDQLREDLGREPTHFEVADSMNPTLPSNRQLTPQRVQQIQKAQMKDIIGSSFESDPTGRAGGREHEVIGLMRPNLTPEQQVVFDHLYGLNGKQRITSTTGIANALGKSPSQVSRLRTGIANVFKTYHR